MPTLQPPSHRRGGAANEAKVEGDAASVVSTAVDMDEDHAQYDYERGPKSTWRRSGKVASVMVVDELWMGSHFRASMARFAQLLVGCLFVFAIAGVSWKIASVQSMNAGARVGAAYLRQHLDVRAQTLDAFFSNVEVVLTALSTTTVSAVSLANEPSWEYLDRVGRQLLMDVVVSTNYVRGAGVQMEDGALLFIGGRHVPPDHGDNMFLHSVFRNPAEHPYMLAQRVHNTSGFPNEAFPAINASFGTGNLDVRSEPWYERTLDRLASGRPSPVVGGMAPAVSVGALARESTALYQLSTAATYARFRRSVTNSPAASPFFDNAAPLGVAWMVMDLDDLATQWRSRRPFISQSVAARSFAVDHSGRLLASSNGRIVPNYTLAELEALQSNASAINNSTGVPDLRYFPQDCDDSITQDIARYLLGKYGSFAQLCEQQVTEMPVIQGQSFFVEWTCRFQNNGLEQDSVVVCASRIGCSRAAAIHAAAGCRLPRWTRRRCCATSRPPTSSRSPRCCPPRRCSRWWASSSSPCSTCASSGTRGVRTSCSC